ncbi:unnamed protein product [Pleuronectes platessa]|uniref:Uncharacterized protein n=1 Tax=Pleuronectes platessa TaxID=8262 RepID=A0A9N7V196_PLEPL|nr:unnamed protein product [Pleuronectes platessa]
MQHTSGSEADGLQRPGSTWRFRSVSEQQKPEAHSPALDRRGPVLINNHFCRGTQMAASGFGNNSMKPRTQPAVCQQPRLPHLDALNCPVCPSGLTGHLIGIQSAWGRTEDSQYHRAADSRRVVMQNLRHLAKEQERVEPLSRRSVVRFHKCL